MEVLIRLVVTLTPVAWMAAAAAYLVVFVRQDAGAERWAPRLAWLAAAINLAALAAPGFHGICPMVLPGSMVSGLALSVGVVHLLVEGRANDRAIGVFPITTAMLLAVAAASFDPLHRPDTAVPAGKIAVHVTGAILGYAGLLLAGLFGVLYLVQQSALKQHRFGLFWERLPSLELLDAFSRRSLLAGVAFLTVTIAFGHVIRMNMGEPGGYWDAKIVATNLLWLAGVVVVLARSLNRMRPATSASVSIALFVAALLNQLVVDSFSKVHQGF